jgi:hypothetical protein
MQQTIDTVVDCVEQALLVEDPRVGLVDFLEAAMRAQATDRGNTSARGSTGWLDVVR